MKAAVYALLTMPLLAQQDVSLYSVEKERFLGQRLASEVKRQSKPLDHPLVDAYVKRTGRELAGHLADSPFVYSFEVILAANTEPISLPGGIILIPARFFLTARDEAEFIGMLAHSIGHIALRHGTRTAMRGQAVNMASIPLVFMGGWMGAHADGRGTALVPIGFLKFQRTYELEADRFGIELAARAGYDAAAFRRYIERAQPPDADSDPRMAPLPARDVRLAGMDELLRSLPVPPPSSSAAEFERIQEAVREALGRPAQRRAPTLRR
ncbi:MAG: M48 family metalloprotease [Bryobacteraceae bacterium]